MDIFKKVEKNFETEYDTFTRLYDIVEPPRWYDKEKDRNDTIVRLLAVAMFAQSLGVAYEEIDPLYNYYKEKVENYGK